MGKRSHGFLWLKQACKDFRPISLADLTVTLSDDAEMKKKGPFYVPFSHVFLLTSAVANLDSLSLPFYST